MTPTQRTLEFLRKTGWHAAVVEKRIQIPNSPHGRLIDVWGFGDILAAHRFEAKIALVQCTSGAGANERRRKLLGKMTEADKQKMDPKRLAIALKVPFYVKEWIEAGGIVMLISWSKMGKAGERKLWTERVETIERRTQ